MGKRFDGLAYMDACKDGDEILAFCKEHQIVSYADLMDSTQCFPEEKQEIWFKRLCSTNFVRFLAAHGIK